MSDSIHICSIDIGKKNFCFYIEESNQKDMEKINDIIEDEDTHKYNDNGTPTLDMENILDKLSTNGKTILQINTDLTKNTDKTKYLDSEIYYNMIDHLDKYTDYFDKCSVFVIEQQMSRNTMALKLARHCFSYFAIKYRREKTIVEFPSYHKTCVLGAIRTRGKKYKNGKYKWKTMNQTTRKKWAITKALDILKSRGEENIITSIKNKKKKDDISDTICQLVAYKYLHFVSKTI
jgi:hypothetical protein